MTQQTIIINRLKKGWCNSLQAVADCYCLKLSTRVNELRFLNKIYDLGYRLDRKENKATGYVSYRLTKM